MDKDTRLTDCEFEELIRDAITAYCHADTREAVMAWFDKQMVVIAAVTELGLLDGLDD